MRENCFKIKMDKMRLLPFDIIKNILTYDKRIAIKGDKILFNNRINLEDEKYTQLNLLYKHMKMYNRTSPFIKDGIERWAHYCLKFKYKYAELSLAEKNNYISNPLNYEYRNRTPCYIWRPCGMCNICANF